MFYWSIWCCVPTLWPFFYPADKISSTNARVIEDKRVQQLCIDVRRCTYYETCATYGLNVDRVFNESEFHLKIGAKIACYFQSGWQCWLDKLVSLLVTHKIVAAKKQAALLASCKSLPNSPSHSGASTPVSGPGQVSQCLMSLSDESHESCQEMSGSIFITIMQKVHLWSAVVSHYYFWH